MNGQETESDYRFLAGLAMGGLVGAGLAIWLAPRAASEIKSRAAGAAKNIGDAVSGRYRDARLRVTGAMDELARKGQAMRNDACDTVVAAAQQVESGARDVETFATDAKSNIG